MMKEKMSLTGVIAGIILILIAGFLRISHFGTEIIELELLIYIVIIFLLFYIGLYLNYELKRKYYSRLGASYKYTLQVLFYPKDYFKKQDFQKGYLIFLVSRILFIVLIYMIIRLFSGGF